MGSVLQKQKPNQVIPYIEKVFDISQKVCFFPIRHNSPACAYHVHRAIEIYSPEIVLIEGPFEKSFDENIVKVLAASTPPIAIYYAYKKDDIKSSCYYPILEFSPEYAAIKAAFEKNIPACFIDLPYGNIACKDFVKKTEKEENDKNTYYNDYYLKYSSYIKNLCEKEHCRDYFELWEKLFELSVKDISTQQFVKNLYAFCYFSRVDYSAEMISESYDDIREIFMAHKINNAIKKYNKILVVTGGFHTYGILKLLDLKKSDIKSEKPLSGESYIIPYSFDECDRLSGYESGMPYPAYYNNAFFNIKNFSDKNPYEVSNLLYITKIAGKLRKKKENISLSEETGAFYLCKGLSELRKKDGAGGVYELLDSIQSSFVKGELNISTSFVMREAEKVLKGSGKKCGEVATFAPTAPIVVDFQEKIKKFRLNSNNLSLKKELTLDIISKEKHRMQSAFLHQVCYLNVPFATKTYGPDYEKKTSTKIVREKWDYAFNGRVVSALIENSHLGGTVLEAVVSKLEKEAEKASTAEQITQLFLKSAVFSVIDNLDIVSKKAEKIFLTDMSFISIGEAFNTLGFIKNISHILRLSLTHTKKIEKLIEIAFNRIIMILPTISADEKDEKQDVEFALVCKAVYRIAFENKEKLLRFSDALLELTSKLDCPPCLQGAAAGILCTCDSNFYSKSLGLARGYFTSIGNKLLLSGRFLRGIFMTAKDIVFYGSFLEDLSHIIKKIEYEKLLLVLPDLRLAFSEFTPIEIDKISKNILKILGLGNEILEISKNAFSEFGVDEECLKLGIKFDKDIFSYLKEKGWD